MAKPVPADFAAYARGFGPQVQKRLRDVRTAVRRAAPGATETILYGMPAFRLNSARISFGAFAQHIGFYPGAAAIAAFKNELSGLTVAKGSVQFPNDRPLPIALITAISAYRLRG